MFYRVVDILDSVTRQKGYEKVDPNDQNLFFNSGVDHWGYRLHCGRCGLVRYLLGQEAKDYYETFCFLRCKNCNERTERGERLPERRAVHLSNIQRRKTKVDKSVIKS